MIDKALENAEVQRKQLLERRNVLNAELIAVEDGLRRVETFIKEWHLFSEDTEGIFNQLLVTEDRRNENKTAGSHSATKRPRNPDRTRVAGVVREIIKERGEPVGRSELFAELKSRGIVIEGKDPEMVLSTMLWRERHRVVRLDKGGYWLKEVNYPPSDYYPYLEPMSGVADDSKPVA